jgi:SAM-dependent methyltransferase
MLGSSGAHGHPDADSLRQRSAPENDGPGAADLKQRVADFWESGSCGEAYAQGDDFAVKMEAHAAARYRLEPYLPAFADFKAGKDRDVLEIGVGMGCDHVQWAAAGPRSLHGIDLTERAIHFTADRLALHELSSQLQTADAESLPFADDSLDLVYSWGVLHHSPDTPRAIREVHRVLRTGGRAKIMIYHTWSVTGIMLWLRYALLAGRPLRSLRDIYHHHLESPGTKAYTVREARELFAGFERVEVSSCLNHGDLLQGEVGQRHQGLLLTVAKRFWPRWLIRRLLVNCGTYLLIDATK